MAVRMGVCIGIISFIVTKMKTEKFAQITEAAEDLATLPLEYARAVRTSAELEVLSYDQKREVFDYIRKWAAFTEKMHVDATNPFAVRYAVSQFAAEVLGDNSEVLALEKAAVAELHAGSLSYAECLPAGQSILSDSGVAIYGGTARLGLKMLAGVSVQSELPVNDLDLVVHTAEDVEEKAKLYGTDLAGTRVVGGPDIEQEINLLLQGMDCSMNQCLVYKGQLYYTRQGLEDVRNGNIRILSKADPLFGFEGVPLPDGNVYINRRGFYRGLSFLLRGKGDQLLVSKENIELEKGNIGRYWLIMLYVKLLKMKNSERRDAAVCQWFSLAQELGSTTTQTPLDFLHELQATYPGTRLHNTEEAKFDINQQARWLINKLVSRVGEAVVGFGQQSVELPETYTPANIKLPPLVPYDLADFYAEVNPTT